MKFYFRQISILDECVAIHTGLILTELKKLWSTIDQDVSYGTVGTVVITLLGGFHLLSLNFYFSCFADFVPYLTQIIT